MGFLAPSLLLGLAAAVLPWLVHLVGKRKVQPVRFAAMELLLRAERQVSARRRLRQILLLVTRTAIAAALPLVFAKPFAETPSDVPAAAARPQSAVVVLDDSASMRRRDGEVLFDRARSRARELLSHFSPESDVALLLASEGTPTPVGELSTDRARIGGALDAAAPSARPADFTAAMHRAAQVLATSEREERRIYLVTDLQATGWEAGVGLPDRGGPDVVVIDASGGQSWDNRAVVGLAVEPAADAGATGVAITAAIANFSPRDIAGIGVSLRIDGAVVTRALLDLPRQGRTKKRFLHTFGAGGGPHWAEVELDPDVLPLDDRRATLVEAARGMRVLVVNGDPRTVRTEDETFFLEAALRAGGDGLAVTTVLPDELAARPLGSYSSVFIANLAEPPEAFARTLFRYVEAGGGVFICVGDRVNADVWNQRLGRLLPQPLGLPRTASALPGGRTEGETVDTRPAERLAPIDRRHPLLAPFAARGEGLASARFVKLMLLAPAPDAPGRSVVLRYESGAPALVEAEVGRGRVLLLSTTCDRDWTDLPIRPGFLPLIQEAARRLGGAPSKDALAASLVGQPREIAINPDDRRIEVKKPGGAERIFRSESLTGHRALTFTETDEPGLYRVRAASAAGAVEERPADSFVVTIDPRESDPARLAPDRRPDRRRPVPGDGVPPKHRIELWHGLAAAVIVLLLCESILAVRFRRAAIATRR